MKKKVVIKVLIFILTILLLIVIYNVVNMFFKKNTKQNNNNYNIQDNINTLENKEIFDSEEAAAPEEGYNDSAYIFFNESKVVKYDNSQLDNIEFTVTNIPNEAINYVINIESVKKQIKKYVYLNGLVDSTIANYKTHQIQEENGKIAILFELNNKKKTQLVVIVNKKNNLVEINER